MENKQKMRKPCPRPLKKMSKIQKKFAPLLQRTAFTRRSLHTAGEREVHTHTQSFLPRETFYTEQFLHARTFTQRKFQSEIFTQKTFTRKFFYTQKLLHTEIFTQRNFCVQKFLHTNFFTHIFFHQKNYTEELSHFSDRNFDTENSLRIFHHVSCFMIIHDLSS